MSNTKDIGQRVEQYVGLRDKIKEMDDEHKKKMAPFKDALEKLGNLMMQHLQSNGAESIKTEAGTFYTTTKKNASLADADAFMKFVIEKEAWHLLDRKANVSAVEDFAKENGVTPPGVNFSSHKSIGVRRS